MANLLQMAGSQPQKQPRYVPLFIDREFTGIYTQRNPLHDPSDLATSRFYGGRPDAILDGRNIELTNLLTLGRRPGLSPFSTATYPTPPDRSFSFELLDGTIEVIIDTGSSGSLAVSASAGSSGGSNVYTGVFPGGVSNSYVGLYFTFAGFTNAGNNGTFFVTASSTTSLTVTSATGVAETIAATTSTTGAVYIDNQDGTKTLLWAKTAGAGATYFVAVAGILYTGDGVQTHAYTPGVVNLAGGPVWNWGIAPPLTAPSVTIVESANASVQWAPNTVWSTMGLIYDTTTSTIQQLISVNASTTNTTQFGTSGSGQPAWNQTPGGTTPDTAGGGTITWTNLGPIVSWSASTTYNNISIGGTVANPAAIYDPVTASVYVNINPGLAQGTSGLTKPNFKAGVGQDTQDGSVKWFYLGPGGIPGTWLPGHSYPKFGTVSNNDTGSSIVEPNSLNDGLPTNVTLYLQASGGGTSGTSTLGPTFSTIVGVQTGGDGDLIWMSLGSGNWAATTFYGQWTTSGQTFSAIKDSNGNFQVCTTSGTSGTVVPGTSDSISQAIANTPIAGQTTYLGTFPVPFPVGAGNIPLVVTGFTNPGNNGSFSIVSSTTGQVVVQNPNGVNETAAATGVYNPWGTAYGATTSDGTVVWTCVGQSMNWTTSTKWYLPAIGFSPPSSSSPYGGASIIDPNNNVEFVINSGLGGGTTPSWAAVGLTTTDFHATWFNEEAFSANSLSWQIGLVYAYSFAALSPEDYYYTLLNGALPIPPGLSNPLPTPITGSQTEDISTASPVFTITGGNAGAVNTIKGLGSTDPQVNAIIIWRSADGGGASNLFELTVIPAPPPIGGIAQHWTFMDYLPSTPETINGIAYPGLDNLIPAPIDEENNPPPNNFLPMAYNFERIWGAVGSTVFFSGGPDVITGNPNAAFNPSDEFPFLANVVRLVKTSQGLVTFLTDDIQIIAGGPETSTFYSVEIGPGIGLLSYNALDVYAGEIFFFSSDSQFRAMSPSLQITSAGFPIGDRLALLDASKVWVAVQQAGVDNCIMVADGSTGWWRVNPRQVPGGANGPEPIWSPEATIVGGAGMVQSIEVQPGIKRLLVGGTGANQQILQRDLTVFTDNGTAYDAWFTIGSIMLVHPGELALLKFIEADFSGVDYQPTISFLLNEISGTFTPFTLAPVFDPPSLYGTTITPTSYSPLRYYFAGTGSLARCRHLQIKVDLGTTPNNDQMFNMTIFGRMMIEG